MGDMRNFIVHEAGAACCEPRDIVFAFYGTDLAGLSAQLPIDPFEGVGRPQRLPEGASKLCTSAVERFAAWRPTRISAPRLRR